MRVLLIDNYDSYTYNLYQLIAVVGGHEPMVLVNDDPGLTTLDESTVDCVVISPGPGRPQHVTDLGWAWELLDNHPGLPMLGVCLGHQAIAYHAGARVLEHVPRHGHVTEVRHDGGDLFAGIPSRFAAVRYHSLHVPEPMPPDLEATAWAEDGTVMALRHRRLPRWGVQFHPESVATEHGATLMRNFLTLARVPTAPPRPAPSQPAPPRPAPPRPAPPRSTPARPAPPVEKLSWDVVSIDGAVDAEGAFAELYADRPYAFWLDSSGSAAGRGRFSFLGDDSGPLAEVLTYRTGGGVVDVRYGDRTGTEPGTIFDVLDRRLARRRLGATGLPFDLVGGYVGYFGYETKADCGGSNVHVAETPDAVWLFADRLVAIDHVEHRTYVLALSPAGAARDAARAWIDRTAARLRGLPDAPSTVELSDVGDGVAGGAALSRSREQYLADIEACAAELRRGESYEICLTNRVRLPAVDDPLAYYRVLRRINPAPYGAYLRLGDFSVLSSSPERFLRIEPDGTVESKPIKGTTPRGRDPRRDEELRRSLVTSTKTRAENLMIVDLLRNDLGRVCEAGSVEVPSFMVTESYATVHQLVSTIRGRLRESVSAIECVRACFPGGSMTGAPKLRTMEIIDRLERGARGVYSGTLGYFGLHGGCDLSIVIRTAVATATGITVGMGGAIVLDSDPGEEFDESMLKAEALVRAHRLATRLSR